MNKKNLRRISTTIQSQTLYHLEYIRKACGYADIGQVIDKVVREKQLQLRESVRGDNYVKGNRR